jgi:cyclic pyranopterin phosphate synthase
MLDSFDRRIRYLRVSVTDRCNLRCEYCSPELSCSRERAEPLSLEDLARIVRAAVDLGVDKVRVTGGEPLLREGILGFVRDLASMRGLATLGLTTNGILLAPVAASLADAGLKSVNVSLDSVDPAEYRRATGGGELRLALHGIEAALAASMAVKLNVVVAAGDPAAEARAEAVEAYAREAGAAVQRIRRYDASIPKVEDPSFDRPPPCGSCDRIRLLADGTLLSCLHSSAAVAVDLERIEASVLECVAMKPRRGAAAAMASLREIGG